MSDKFDMLVGLDLSVTADKGYFTGSLSVGSACWHIVSLCLISLNDAGCSNGIEKFSLINLTQVFIWLLQHLWEIQIAKICSFSIKTSKFSKNIYFVENWCSVSWKSKNISLKADKNSLLSDQLHSICDIQQKCHFEMFMGISS